MSYEHILRGAMGGTSVHRISAPTPGPRHPAPHLSLVPDADRIRARQPISSDQWQDRALCAQTDPEAFFPEKGGSTREAKRICLGCEVRDGAWSTHWPTTSVSASGAVSPSASAVASSAASSRPSSGRRPGYSSSIVGSMTEARRPGRWRPEPPESRAVVRRVPRCLSPAARSACGTSTIRARVALPRTSTPAGISRASAIGPSATTSGGHCTLSGSFGADARNLVDGDVQCGHPLLPAALDRFVGLEHRHVEPLGAAAPPRHRRGKQRAAHFAAAGVQPTCGPTRRLGSCANRPRGDRNG